jgi:hypothetical protein
MLAMSLDCVLLAFTMNQKRTREVWFAARSISKCRLATIQR